MALGFLTRNSSANRDVSMALRTGSDIGQRDGSQMAGSSVSSAGSLSDSVI